MIMKCWKYTVMIAINFVEINHINALYNPEGVDMPLNKWTKPNQTKQIILG